MKHDRVNGQGRHQHENEVSSEELYVLVVESDPKNRTAKRMIIRRFVALFRSTKKFLRGKTRHIRSGIVKVNHKM